MTLNFGVILFSLLRLNFGNIVYNLYPPDIESKTKKIKRARLTLI